MSARRLPEPLVPVLGVAGVVLCAWAAALARPRADEASAPTAPALRAVVLDVSGSAARTRRGFGRWLNRVLREEALAALEGGEDLCVVRVAAEAQVAFGPAPAADLVARLEGRGEPFQPGLPAALQHQSRLDEAVAVAGAALRFPGRAPGRLVMVVDRSYTGGDPAPRLAGLTRDGFGLEWRPLPPQDRPDLAVRALRLPRTVEPGAPSGAQVEVALSPGRVQGEVALEVEVDGPGGVDRRRVPLTPPAGSGLRTWTVTVELPARQEGRHRVGVRAVLDGDAVPENDAAGGEVEVGGVRHVLLASSDPLREPARAWLAAERPGLQVETCALEDLGRRLPGADVLVSADLGPADLPDGFGDWVRAGGGWVALLGWRSLGSWERQGQGQGEPSDLLPLQPTADSGEDRDVILIVDGSGSMEGEPFERVKRAVFELVPAARPSDTIELRFFTQALHPVEFESRGRRPEERREELAPLLEARVPRGGTDIGYSLQALAKERTSSDSRGLVLLLTDGVGSTYPAIDARRALATARLDLRVLRIGDIPKGRAFLEGLLLPGEALVEAGDLSDLGRLLQLEVNRHRVREEPGMSAVSGPAAGPLAELFVPAMAAAAPAPEAWAPLTTYARAEAVEGAEVLWRSSVEGEPLLAVQRVGLGLVAAAATHPGWAPFLASRPALVEPLVRAGARGRPADGPRLVDAGGVLLLEGCPVDWPLDLALELHLPPERDGFGGVEEGPALDVLPLLPGAGGSALDPRSLRHAAGRGLLLDGLTRGTGLEGRLVAGGQRLATLPLNAAGPAEWDGGGAPLVPEPPVPATRPAPAGREAPHPAAPWVLGSGGALLALAALLGLLGGQGISRPGRTGA